MSATELKEPRQISNVELEELLGWIQARASATLRRHRSRISLDTCALVNEACLKILRGNLLNPSTSKAYLYGAASHAVREALADAVRRKMRLKSGAEFSKINLFDPADSENTQHADLLDLHTAVEALKDVDSNLSRLVDLKFYAGWTIQEIAQELEVSTFTVEERWRKARKFLYRFLSDKPLQPRD